jgi:hypothetical protein
MKTTYVIQFGRGNYIPQKKTVREFRFPFTVVDSRYEGTSEEQSHTSTHEIFLGVTDLVDTSWGLQKDELKKVLLTYGQDHIQQRLRAGSLSTREELLLTTRDTPAKLQFDPTSVQNLEGARILVTVED